MLELSPVEEWTLRALRCLFRPLLVRIVLWFFVALFMYWLIQRVNTVNTTPGVHRVSLGTESGSCNTLTLLDPQKLRETLKTFALPNKPGSKGDRYRTEALCRSLLESMLGMPLPKVRPKWLVNPSTKRSLELDMYNAEHHIAFEYDGAQHDVYTPHFHNNPDHFKYRQLLDKLKDELCRDAKVTLIRIPWSEVSCHNEIRTAQFLERLLRSHRIPFQSVLMPGEP